MSTAPTEIAPLHLAVSQELPYPALVGAEISSN